MKSAGCLAALLVCALCASCSELPKLEANVCGNGVTEPERDEQCDLSEDEDLGDSLRCGDPTDVLRACHYVCTRSTSGPHCPRGWGCSDDGICRYASGDFQEIEDSPIELQSFTRISLADIDGDGRNDLVAGAPTGISVYFGRKNNPFTVSFRYPVQSVSQDLAFGDVDNDTQEDIVGTSPVGPFLLRGQRGRSLEPVIVSQLDISDLRDQTPRNLAWFRVVPAHPDLTTPCFGPLDPAKNIVAFGTANRFFMQFADANEHPFYQREYPNAGLPGRIPSVDLNTATRGYGGDEVLLALPGTEDAHVFVQKCVEGQPGVYHTEMNDVTIPLPDKIAGIRHLRIENLVQDTVLAADMDADGDLDLLFPLEPLPAPLGRDAQRVAFAENLGDTFDTAKVMPEFDILDDYSQPMSPGGGDSSGTLKLPQNWPLAAGDLDSDGDADFVGTGGMFIWMRENEDGIPGDQMLFFQLSETFSEAVITDIDGDSTNDVVAVRASDGALVVYSSLSGFGLPYFAAPKVIATDGVPSMLRVGDFDGDGFNDVAFAEQGQHFGVSLSVLYGRDEQLVALGSPSNVRDIESASAGAEDGRTDLFLVSKSDDEMQSWQVGLLFGTQERTMIAPLPVGDAADNRVALADVAGGPDVDLAVLGFGEIDVAPGDGTGRFGEFGNVARTPWSEALGGGDGFVFINCARMISANVDRNNDKQELVAVLDGACLDVFQSNDPMSDTSKHPSVLALGENTADGFRVRTQELPEAMRGVSQLRALDLDANGSPELILVYTEAGAGGIAIFWNLSFDLTAGQPISYDGAAPTILLLDGGTKTPFAIAPINADATPTDELAILGADTEQGVAYIWIAKIDGPASIDLGDPVQEIEISPRQSLELLAEDVDRDGLSDLLFGDGARVHVFRSRPQGEEPQ